jgi:hypothetical protein
MLSFQAIETILIKIRTQTVFLGCGLCFCNLLFETNNSGFGTVLLSRLVSELQEPPSLGLELRTLIPSFDLSIFSSWSQEIHMPSLVQIGFCSQAISKHTHTISILDIRLKLKMKGQNDGKSVLSSSPGEGSSCSLETKYNRRMSPRPKLFQRVDYRKKGHNYKTLSRIVSQ